MTFCTTCFFKNSYYYYSMLSVCTNNHSKFLVCENYLANKVILILILILKP